MSSKVPCHNPDIAVTRLLSPCSLALIPLPQFDDKTVCDSSPLFLSTTWRKSGNNPQRPCDLHETNGNSPAVPPATFIRLSSLFSRVSALSVKITLRLGAVVGDEIKSNEEKHRPCGGSFSEDSSETELLRQGRKTQEPRGKTVGR